MKKLFLAILFCTLLLAAPTLAFDFDNVKEFNPNVPTHGQVKVINAWGLGDDIADYILMENTDTCLTDCYAEGTVELYDKQKVFNQIKFIDKRKKNRQVDFTLYIEQSRDVTKIRRTSDEGCMGAECLASQVETEYVETEYYWEEYDYGQLDPGLYKWRLEGKKDADVSVDWVIDAMGLEFDEWAWWNASYTYKRNITVYAPSGEDLKQYATATVCGLDTAALITAGKMQANGNDTALVYNGATQIDFIWLNETKLNASDGSGVGDSNSCIQFPVQADISSGSSVNTYEFFYGDADLTNQDPTYRDAMDVFLVYDDFDRANGAPGGATELKPAWTDIAGSAVISNDELISTASTTNTCLNFSTTDVTIPKHRLYWRGYGDDARENGVFFGDADSNFGQFRAGASIDWNSYSDRNDIYHEDNGGVDKFKSSADATASAFVLWETIYDATTGEAMDWYDGTRAVWDVTNTTHTGVNALVGLCFQLAPDSANAKVDYVLFQIDYSPASAHSFGAEETTIVSPTTPVPTFNRTIVYNDTWVTESDQYLHGSGKNATVYKNLTVNDAYIAENISEAVTNGTTTYWDLDPSQWVRGDNVSVIVTYVDVDANTATNLTAITVSNYDPTTPTQNYPADTSLQSKPSILLNCSGSTDADVESINYEFYTSTDLASWNLGQNTTATEFNFSATANTTYYWRCRANDAYGTSGYTTNWSFLVDTDRVYNITATYDGNVTENVQTKFGFIVGFNPNTVASVTGLAFYDGVSRAVSNKNTTYKEIFNFC